MAMHLLTSVAQIKLTGSPSQSKWAQSLRLRRATIMQKGGIRTLLLAIKPCITEEDLQAMRCTAEKNILRFAHGVAIHMLSCPQARWWIDHRDDLPYHNVQASTRACIEHYTRTKPFK